MEEKKLTVESAKILAVIPVRMSSQRLPGKPLTEIEGKTLVQRVWERAKASNCLKRVVVSTDSQEIEEAAKSFGAEVVMTSADIQNGSERVAATMQILGVRNWDVVVNVQGDMPFIRPELIDQTVDFFISEKWNCAMATVATPIHDEGMYRSVNDVKVVVSSRQEALYFSRAAVPHSRDGDRMLWGEKEVFGFKHFGLYAYKPEIVTSYLTEPPSMLEEVEKLEQLRLLEKGHKIAVCIVDNELTSRSVEVDTPKDLERARAIARGE